jgi:hypothetical protein
MKSRWFAYALLLSVLCVFSCKGDGGGPTFLEVVSFAPADGRDDVQVDIQIGVRVSERIDPSTLTNETFVLTGPGGAVVPSTVRVLDEADADPSGMGTGALLIPDDSLDVITEYTVTVKTGLLSTSGKSLEEDFDWSFMTLDAAWGEAEWIEPAGVGNSLGQDIAVDEELSAIAVWTLEDEVGGTIFANRYTRVDLWGEEPEPISDAAGNAANPKLAVDAAGNAFAVWERSTSVADQNIWANRYDVEAGSWGDAALLQDGQARARTPSVAADPSGNAIAVWVEFDDAMNQEVIRAIRYEPGTGWGNAETIGSPEFTVSMTDVGMDDQGRGIAVWNPLAGGVGGRVLKANRYTPGVGWLDVAEVEEVKSDVMTSADGFRLDVGANGDAFVIWVQNEPAAGDRNDIHAARFSGGNWSDPVNPPRIDNHDADDKTTPDIAVDGTGVAYAVWSQAGDADGFENIWVAEYTPGPAVWGDPVFIEPPNEDPNEDGNATTPRVDVNRAGNVFVVWRQVWDQAPSIWSNRRDPGTSWNAANAERIEDFPAAASRPIIAVDEARHAHALWQHNAENTLNMRTNRFE